jgi:hypothetical protein
VPDRLAPPGIAVGALRRATTAADPGVVVACGATWVTEASPKVAHLDEPPPGLPGGDLALVPGEFWSAVTATLYETRDAAGLPPWPRRTAEARRADRNRVYSRFAACGSVEDLPCAC